MRVGNQLPILLIDFFVPGELVRAGWESVTDPLDRLLGNEWLLTERLGISYRSS